MLYHQTRKYKANIVLVVIFQHEIIAGKQIYITLFNNILE